MYPTWGVQSKLMHLKRITKDRGSGDEAAMQTTETMGVWGQNPVAEQFLQFFRWNFIILAPFKWHFVRFRAI